MNNSQAIRFPEEVKRISEAYKEINEAYSKLTADVISKSSVQIIVSNEGLKRIYPKDTQDLLNKIEELRIKHIKIHLPEALELLQ
jgi:virulence-associated protein VagC